MASKRKKTDPKLAKLYQQRREEFTAADLVKYTEITPTVPARQVLAELESMRQKQVKKNGRKKSA